MVTDYSEYTAEDLEDEILRLEDVVAGIYESAELSDVVDELSLEKDLLNELKGELKELRNNEDSLEEDIEAKKDEVLEQRDVVKALKKEIRSAISRDDRGELRSAIRTIRRLKRVLDNMDTVDEVVEEEVPVVNEDPVPTDM